MLKNEDDIWKIFVHDIFQVNQWPNECKTFVMKIYQNDLTYVSENYSKIIKSGYLDSFECFFVVVALSNDTKMIDFLMKICPLNINYVLERNNIKSYSYLMIACYYNPNIDIITHMVNKYQANVKYKNRNGEDCLSMGCQSKNLLTVKYLVEKYYIVAQTYYIFSNGMDNYYGGNVNISLCTDEILKYLFSRELYREKCNMMIKKLSYDDLFRIVTLFKNDYILLNYLLKACYRNMYYIPDSTLKVIKTINPLMLNTEVRSKANIEHPAIIKFSEFTKLVDSLPHILHEDIGNSLLETLPKKKIKREKLLYKIERLEDETDQCIDKIEKIKETDQCIDYTNQSQLLFKINGVNFFAHRNIVYNSIIFLKNIIDSADFREPIEIDFVIQPHVINQYIHSCYTNHFNINNILPCDFISFIKFIDRFPTKILSIDKLEQQIIDYMDDHSMDYHEIKEFTIRYELKFMYLHIHNDKYKKIESNKFLQSLFELCDDDISKKNILDIFSACM